MRLRLIGGFVGVAGLILVIFSIPLAQFVAKVERERFVTQVERDAFILAGHAKETLSVGTGTTLRSLQPYVDAFKKADGAHVIVTDSVGRVIASDDTSVVLGTDYTNRPEVLTALKGVPSTGERRSNTLGQDLLFVAVPVLSGDDTLGVVRLSHPATHVDHEVRQRIAGILGAGAISLVAAVMVAILLGLTISNPIARLRRATDRLGRGDFDARAEDGRGPKELRELARSFNSMSGRLGLMVEGQQHFAGAVSHQLRTPLTALRLRLEQAEGAVGSDDAVVAEALEASRAEADRLQEMVEQLLALARLEGAAAKTVEVDAARVARDRVEMWAPLADENSVTIRLETPVTARCAVIEGGLEQILDNYIDNAISVAPAGSEILVDISADDGHLTVDVCDRGPGLTEEQRDLAFDRFWRGPATTGATGSGLGLAIVRQLAAASGGEAELLGNPGGGIRARVRLQAR